MGQIDLDGSNSTLKADVIRGQTGTTVKLGGVLDTDGNYIQTEKGGDLTSASPLVIDTDGSYFDVTGTTNFAAMTVAADRQFTLQFDGVLTMTHHATNLDLPGEANITTAAGDVATFQSTGSNTVQCINYTKADGTGVVSAGGGSVTNLLLNSQFAAASRGTSFISTGDFPNNDDVVLIDQYYNLSDGNDIVDVTQQAAVFTGMSHAIRLDVETASKKFGILQILENRDCESIIGGTASLSFTAKVNDNSAGRLDNIKAAVVSWSSTKDSPTTDIISTWNAEDTTPTLIANWTFENTPANLNVTTSEARYTIENISIDTASAANIGIFIWSDGFTGTVTDTLEISGVQLETGATANDYSPVPYGIELNRTGRYIQVLNIDAQGMNPGRANATTTALCTIKVPVLLRKRPTFIEGGSAGMSVMHATGITAASSVSITNISDGNDVHGVQAKSNNHTGLTDNAGVTVSFQGDYWLMSAEF